MPGFDGTGPNGMGPMTGGGRGFCGSWGAGRRNYTFRRQAPYAYPHYGGYGYGSFAPRMSRDQELEFLKSQAEALKQELEQLEAEINELSVNKGDE